MVWNGSRGNSGRYFIVRNKDSEIGLSSLTHGRLNDAAMPRPSSIASIVDPFIGPPLSACSVSVSRPTPSATQMRSTSRAEWFIDSSS